MKSVLISILLFVTFGIPASAFANGETIEVSIKKFKFIPQEITVKIGTTVRWVNTEKRQYHSVWFKEAGEPPSDYFFPEETYEHRFDKAGTFPYTCEPHPKMSGVVHVTE